MPLPELGSCLLIRARNAIAAEFGRAPLPEGDHPLLAEPGASFVTLKLEGELRGCIGTLEASRTLDLDVRSNARAAAFGDPRFAPLSSAELDNTHIEVSLLTPPEPMSFVDEHDALRKLRPDIDGLIFEYRERRSTFLPQMWEVLAHPADFLALLKRKAGLPADFWAPEVRLARYRVNKWKEINS